MNVMNDAKIDGSCCKLNKNGDKNMNNDHYMIRVPRDCSKYIFDGSKLITYWDHEPSDDGINSMFYNNEKYHYLIVRSIGKVISKESYTIKKF